MAEEKETIKCPKCGTENSIENTYCENCGQKLDVTKKEIKVQKETNKKVKNPFLETIFFFIFSLVTSVLIILFSMFKFTAFEVWSILESGKIYSRTDIYDNATSLLDQIFMISSNADLHIRTAEVDILIGIIVLFAFLSCFIIWGIFKFNRIEKRILELQDKLNKE